MTDWLGMQPTPRTPRPALKAQVLERALQPRRGKGGSWRLAAAALVIGALGAAAWWAGSTISALEADLAAVRDTLGFVRRPTTRVRWIPVTTGGRAGAVTIFADSATRRWLVRCEGMAPNAPDETYQIWFVTAGGMKRAALMTMGDEKSAVMAMVFDVPRDVGAVTGAAMSIEPRAGGGGEGGSEPHGPMVFYLRL